MKPPVPLPRIAPILALAALLAAGALGLLYASGDGGVVPPALAQDESCRKNIGVSYYGGGGMPEFTGVQGSGQFEPTVISGKGTAAAKTRDLIDIGNATDTVTCNWSLQSTSVDWITLDATNGAVGPGSGQLVQVSINDYANSLAPGRYEGVIEFNLEGGQPGKARVILNVLETCRIGIRQNGILAVDDHLYTKWDGVKGRHPDPENQFTRNISVANVSTSICDWSIQANVEWISIAPYESGRLPAYGATVNLSLFANDKFLALPEGNHSAEVTITDSSGNVNRNIEIDLALERPPCELHIAENARLESDGEAGGPFRNRFQIFDISNHGDVHCIWNTRLNETWVEVEPLSGLIAENASTTVTVGIREAEAKALAPGTHETEIVFSAGERSPTPSISVSLTVHKLPCDFSVLERDPLSFSGEKGGPFTPEIGEFVISNGTGRGDCAWRVVSSPDWVDVVPAEGTLADGEQVQILAAAASSAKELSPQSIPYTGRIRFDANTDIRGNATMPVELDVNCPPDEPCYRLHSTHTVIDECDTAEFSLSIVNSLSKPTMLAQLRLDIPSGWVITSDNPGTNCSGGQCTGNYKIATGQTENIQITAKPNHPGNLPLEGSLEWHFEGGDSDTTENPLKIPIAVTPADSPCNPVPSPVVSPVATSPPATTPMPTASPDADANMPTPIAPGDGDPSVPPAPPVVPPDPDSSTNILLVVGLVFLAILAIGVVALAIGVLRMRNSGGTPAPPQVPPTRNQQPRPTPTRPGGPGNQRR